jgi:histidine ammonia-lyase
VTERPDHPTPDHIRRVVLTGRDLSLEELVAVARYRARVELAPGARRRMRFSRDVVDVLVAARAKVYGLTTGFGSKRDTIIESAELARLQVNLIRSHACGTGPALAEDQVRAAMLLRANTLARGNSGIRVEVVETLLAFLNRDVFPWIPSKGSLGASGDLAPLSHLALALCNDPEARFYSRAGDEPAAEGPVTPGGARVDYVAEPVPHHFGPAPADLFGGDDPLVPVVLGAKEGLALNNGTQVSTAIGMLTVFDAELLLESAELVGALSLEANKAVRDAFDPRLHEARPLEGQRETAARIRAYIEGSQILDLPINTARLDRAERSMLHARDVLREAGDDLAAGFADEAERVAGEIAAFVGDALDVLEAGRRDATPEETAAFTDRELVHHVYRRALIPLRGDVMQLYTSILKSPLVGEPLKSRDFLADAVTQLQLALPESPAVQDDYSFRCIPQVLGVVRKTVGDTRRVLEIEANSATDNPLIFPPDADAFEGEDGAYAATLTVRSAREAVVSGGNFHGEAVAMALDHLAPALAELASISERRTAHLVDGNLSNGLPSLLVVRSGLNSGLMIPQYVAAGLVSENKILSHPAVVDSIPTCENTEDHVSMSPISARKCLEVLRNAETVVAIELLTAWQGMSFRRPFRAGRATETLRTALEDEGLQPIREDRVLYRDMDWVRSFLRKGRVWAIARDAFGG